MNEPPVLTATELQRHYHLSRGLFGHVAVLKALDGASFKLFPRRTLAVVGELGCGKSTLARIVAMIEQATAGSLRIADNEVTTASAHTLRELRPKVQIVFQNPYGSLNPRQRIGAALEEPLLVNTKLSAAERRERAEAMMHDVGLRPEHYDALPPHVLRRPAPAYRHRPRIDAQSRDPGAGRAGLAPWTSRSRPRC